jgi:methylated-DNA-[protein]-cysteine S-methyltransferase
LYSFALQSPIGLLFASVTDRGLRHLHTLSSHHAVDGRGPEAGASPVPTPGEPAFDSVGTGLAPALYGTTPRHSPAEDALAAGLEQQLLEYFDGTRRDFDLPLDLDRGSPFQRRVWEVIARIPYGEVASYAEVAQLAGAPGAFRAAGTACGANPVAIVTPCHRVVASGNKLGGYGLGLESKVWLLRHEGIGATAVKPDARVYKLESVINAPARARAKRRAVVGV